MTTAKNQLQAAITRLLRIQPFWSMLLLRLHISEDPRFPWTIATDGKRLLVNPLRFLVFRPAEAVFAIAHEALHIIGAHHCRRKGRDLELWQIAVDHAVNLLLVEGFSPYQMRPPEGIYLDTRFRGWSPERIYAELAKEGRQSERQKDRQAKRQAGKRGERGRAESQAGRGQGLSAGEGSDGHQAASPAGKIPAGEGSDGHQGASPDGKTPAGEGSHGHQAASPDGETPAGEGSRGHHAAGPVGPGQGASAGEDDGSKGHGSKGHGSKGHGEASNDPASPAGKSEGRGQAGNDPASKVGKVGKAGEAGEGGRADTGRAGLGYVLDAPGDAEHARAELAARLAEAETLCRSAGGPIDEFTRRLVESTRKTVPFDWERHLAAHLHHQGLQRGAHDFSWSRPNPSLLQQSGFYLPTLVEPQPPRLTVAIDTSGSIDADQLAQMRRGLEQMFVLWPDLEFPLLSCDTAIRARAVARGPRLDFEPTGGGGTLFGPVFEETRKSLDLLVYFTDLEPYHGHFPPKPLHPVLWIYTGPLEVPPPVPYGRVARLRPSAA